MNAQSPPWIDIGTAHDIPRRGARVVRTVQGDIAVFRTAEDEIFAIEDRCPHLAGPLSQGIVHGRAVTCPLHNLVVDLKSGEAAGPDALCAKTVPIQVLDGRIYLAASGITPLKK